MIALPPPLTELIQALNRLPGIGPRSAERIALHLVEDNPAVAQSVADALLKARERVRHCHTCGALTEQSPCLVCSDSQRDPAVVCLVEQPVDVITIEKSGAFHGRYHVLGGRISPVNGVEAEDLNVAGLEARLASEPITEVIVALGTDVEGEATSHYLSQRLAAQGIKVSRIAHGLPVGSGLDLADDLTLSQALEGRRELRPDPR